MRVVAVTFAGLSVLVAQVFFYECKGEVEQAVRLARAAFDEAVARMEELSVRFHPLAESARLD